MYWYINNIEIYAVSRINKNKLEKNEIRFWPKKDKVEKKKVIKIIAIIKLTDKVMKPNRRGIENIKVPAKLDLIAFKNP